MRAISLSEAGVVREDRHFILGPDVDLVVLQGEVPATARAFLSSPTTRVPDTSVSRRNSENGSPGLTFYSRQ